MVKVLKTFKCWNLNYPEWAKLALDEGLQVFPRGLYRLDGPGGEIICILQVLT